MEKSEIRILLADHHELVRSGIQRLLNDVPQLVVIGEAASGEEAVQQSRMLHPDVVLMDVQIPGIGGLEATRRIAQCSPESRIIVVTVQITSELPTSLAALRSAWSFGRPPRIPAAYAMPRWMPKSKWSAQMARPSSHSK